jgi:class 3 adenylate cyclase/tetratricopeptide (TPR) repeat protein
MEGERKLVTVLFADVTGYTSLSEKLDPEEIHQIMDGCFRILMEEIHKYEGTINQFTGDGVMALFGAPLAHEDHAQRACHAALAIQKALADYSEKVKNDCGHEFRMRIGLNSGPVVVGSIGDDLRMDYTAVGDTTNLASRMQTMAKPAGIVVSGQIYKLCKDYFEFNALGKLQVKGKEEPQDAFELLQTGIIKTRIGASVVKGLTPFAGRRNSMAALMGPYEEVKAGSGQVVGIMGEPGVGKSRLLLEFRNGLPKDEFSYLEGRCLQYGSSMPYLPILDLLRGYFDIKAGEPEPVVRQKIAEKSLQFDKETRGILIPIQDLLSLEVEDKEYLKLEPKRKKEKIFEALRGWLTGESEKRPLIIAFEDLHWIDKTSEEFLRYLVGWVADVKILLLLLYRPEYVPPWANQSNYNRIALNQLNSQSSAELVQAILEGGDVEQELLDLILAKAGGNPLFMEELTGSLLENGSIQKKDHQYVLSTKASQIKVPDTIQGIIAARMDRLEESLKKIVQVASVIGREFAFRILQAILEMREELKSSLINLQGLEFIYEKRLFPELEYIFKHALTQEVAYNSLLLKRRKEIHEKIGRAIEELYPDRLEEFYEMLAYHYSRSDNLEKACQYLKLSGTKSARNHSLWEAYRFYKEAVNVLKLMPETEQNKQEQIDVILLMGMPMRLLGYPEDSLNFLQEGERLCKEGGDGRSRVTINSFIGWFYSTKGNPALGIKYLEDSLSEAEKLEEIEIMGLPAEALCLAYIVEGEFKKVVNIAPKFIALLEKTKREYEISGTTGTGLSGLYRNYGHSLGGLGRFTEGEQMAEKALFIAQNINDLHTMGMAEFSWGAFLSYKGDGENVVKHARSCISYWEKSQSKIFLPTAWVAMGCGYFFLGELNRALELMERGLKMHLEIGIPYILSYHHLMLSMVHFDLGNLAEAKVHGEQGVNFAQTHRERHWEGMLSIQLGRITGKLETSEIAKAEELIMKGMRILEELMVKPWISIGHLFLGELYSNAGQKEKGLDNLKKAESMFQEMGIHNWLARTKKVLETVQ